MSVMRNSNPHPSKYLIILLVCLTASSSFAADDKGIPEVLNPWKDWILYKHPDIVCPVAFQDGQTKYCAWPSVLDLNVTRESAAFVQRWTVYAPGWVDLPGNEAQWPGGVFVNGQSVPIAVREGNPSLYLKPGDYQISGSITWIRRPEFLQIPIHTGLVSLTLDGKKMDQKNIDQDGKLWFGKMSGSSSAQGTLDAVKVQVFRKLKDGVPVVLESEIHLKVSGKDRELVLGKLLLGGAVPLQFQSPLPARIEPDGLLQIQTRAGEWVVKLSARYPGPVTEFATGKMDDLWPEEEFWVFEANRQLRVVTLTGANLIDPQQTSIPDDWKSLPTYLMQSGIKLALVEQQRGDAGPADDHLELKREMWLDFDGNGFTVRDKITGNVNRGCRLNALPGYAPGRVEINGDPQLITQVESNGQAGIEVRQGKIDMLAVSRRETDIHRWPVAGWDHDFSSVNAQLILPPGWSIFTTLGVDAAHGSWIQDWSLWDIFLVLMIAVSFGRLIHPVWGFVAATTLTLIYHESGSPIFIWLNVLAAAALFKVLPNSIPKRLVRFYLFASLTVLALISVTFSVNQVRQGLYPQLERTPVFSLGRFFTLFEAMDKVAVRQDMYSEKRELLRLEESEGLGSVASQSLRKQRPYAPPPPIGESLNFKSFDAAAQIQTGPGEPDWQWNTVFLNWNGPVTQDQMVRLVFISPAITRMLRFLRVILLAVLMTAVFIYSFILNKKTPSIKIPFMPVTAITAALFFFCSFLSPRPAAAYELGDTPPTYEENAEKSALPDQPPALISLLTELESRLTEAPSCLPNCASLTRGHLLMSPTSAMFRLRIDALARVAVPLPAHRDHWIPQTVWLNGDTKAVVSQDENGQLLLSLSPGTHEIILQGPVMGDAVQFPVNLPAHNIIVDAPGWQVSGLMDGRVPGNSLQLNRTIKEQQRRHDVILPDPILPFVLVEHTLMLGLEWQVHTVVTRLAPEREAINLQIPKLKRSAIITPNVKSENDMVRVLIPPGQQTFVWDSALDFSDLIELAAQQQTQWVERWVVDASTIWHVDYEGIASIKQDPKTDAQTPRWQPWPGEMLRIHVTRPAAVIGSTRTIENVRLNSNPGKRAGTHELQLTLRSSQGGDYVFNLPAGAQIQRFVIDNVEQTNPQEEGVVKIPLHPGMQTTSVTWQEKQGIQFLTRTPVMRLNAPANNITLSVHLPEDRWPLLVGGPRLGPAQLYWGVLVVILLVAMSLGRTQLAPLKTYQWLLLLIGLSTVNTVGGVLVVLWFFAMAKRKTAGEGLSYRWFNLTQVILVLLTAAALISLIVTIPMSLLSTPDMQITGNSSSDYFLNWYQDRSADTFPQGWVVSTSIWIYRLTMLLWSLWMVFALIKWIHWGWGCFSEGALWKHKPALEVADGEE